MKRKLLALTLGACLVLSLVGCGSKEPVSVGSASESPTTKVGDIITEAVESAVESIEEVTETEQLSETEETEIEAESVGRITGSVISNTMILCDYVIEQDKSDEWGVHSTSSADALQFIDDDGMYIYQSLGETDVTGNYDFSGRFAYPVVNTNEFFKTTEIEYRSDLKMVVNCRNEEDKIMNVVTINLGHDDYDLTKNVETEGVTPTTEYGTVITSEGETDVLLKDATEDLTFSIYTYRLGAFTVKIQRNTDTLYTPEELQLIVNSIKLQ